MAVLIAAAFWIVLGLEELTSRGTAGLPPLLDTRATDAPGCTSFAIDRASGAAAASPCHGEILALSRPRASAGESF